MNPEEDPDALPEGGDDETDDEALWAEMVDPPDCCLTYSLEEAHGGSWWVD